jgi:hypothetical protein
MSLATCLFLASSFGRPSRFGGLRPNEPASTLTARYRSRAGEHRFGAQGSLLFRIVRRVADVAFARKSRRNALITLKIGSEITEPARRAALPRGVNLPAGRGLSGRRRTAMSLAACLFLASSFGRPSRFGGLRPNEPASTLTARYRSRAGEHRFGAQGSLLFRIVRRVADVAFARKSRCKALIRPKTRSGITAPTVCRAPALDRVALPPVERDLLESWVHARARNSLRKPLKSIKTGSDLAKSGGRAPALALAAALASGAAQASETIAFLRHGEKPEAGLGQLDCQGLNRALKLPAALAALFPASTFGKPAAIFAPNPSVRERDHDVRYDYVRALATIEPTAVALGMPINTQRGFDEVAGLTKDLEAADYRDGLVIVAWEHRMADEAVRKLLKDYGGDPDVVPKWKRDDFDSVYVVTIDRDKRRATFERKAEGLNGQPDSCPK